MAAIILLIMFIWCGHEALQAYKAEKYANKVVYGLDTGFFSFMISNHPLISIGAILLLIALIAACFA